MRKIIIRGAIVVVILLAGTGILNEVHYQIHTGAYQQSHRHLFGHPHDITHLRNSVASCFESALKNNHDDSNCWGRTVNLNHLRRQIVAQRRK